MMKKLCLILSVFFSSITSADPLGYSLMKRFVDIDELLSKQNIQVQSCSLYYKDEDKNKAKKRESHLGACLYHYLNLHMVNRGEDARVFVHVRFPFQPPSSSDFVLELDWNPVQGERQSFLSRLAQYGISPLTGEVIAMGKSMYRSLRHVEFNLKPLGHPVPVEFLFDEERIIYFTTNLLLENGAENITPTIDNIRITNEPQSTRFLKGEFRDKVNIRVNVGDHSKVQSEMIVDYTLNLRGIKLNELDGEVELMNTDNLHREGI